MITVFVFTNTHFTDHNNTIYIQIIYIAIIVVPKQYIRYVTEKQDPHGEILGL